MALLVKVMIPPNPYLPSMYAHGSTHCSLTPSMQTLVILGRACPFPFPPPPAPRHLVQKEVIGSFTKSAIMLQSGVNKSIF